MDYFEHKKIPVHDTGNDSIIKPYIPYTISSYFEMNHNPF